jgi:HNH endonuclease
MRSPARPVSGPFAQADSARYSGPMSTCGCGCGGEAGIGVYGPRRFLPYHHARIQRKKCGSDYPPPVRDPQSGCLRWQGPHHSAGYGKIGSKGYAHREAYIQEYGAIPAGLEVDHVAARGCIWRDCVEPAHLEAVDHPENVRRSAKIQAQMAVEECPQGHRYEGHNLIIRRGKRECRTCVYDRNAKNRRVRRERAATRR